jgi:hypothetical protein
MKVIQDESEGFEKIVLDADASMRGRGGSARGAIATASTAKNAYEK